MRPVIASTNDVAGPVTSGPLPFDQSMSVARNVRPAARFLPPIPTLDFV